MFTREESSRTKKEFWTVFGKYMSLVPSVEGKINWVNYHTRLKDVYFRMKTGSKSAAICISIEHADHEIQQMYFEQFLELKDLLHDTLHEEWLWQLHVLDEHGKVVSRICKEINGVSVLDLNNWPELISFFKPRIIALDAFWEDAKYSFENLK